MVTEERALTLPAFIPLDVYDGPEPDLYPDWLGTISAGYRDDSGKPVVSRDGTIYVTGGRAPGLADALAANDRRRLLIAFPADDPRAIVRQHFTAYTATKLLAYGNAAAITVIDEKGHHRIPADTKPDEYAQWRAKCKVSTSILFVLARWDGDEPVTYYPDGYAPYRIRTTSRNSVRSVLSALRSCAAFTGGYIAGVPFEITIDYRDVTGPQGDRRKVPVWAFAALKGVEITSRRLRQIMTGALTTGSAIRLLAPPEDLGELALADFEDAGDLDDDALLRLDELQRGGLCDAAEYCRKWFKATEGTPFHDKVSPARAEFIALHCAREGLPLTSSLGAFLKTATDAMALDLISAIELHIVNTRPAPDPETGDIPMTEAERTAASAAAAEALIEDGFAVEEPDDGPERDYEHELAAETRAEDRRAATLTDKLFGDKQPKPAAPDFDPTVLKPWFQNAVAVKGESPEVAFDRAHEIGDLLASVTQSLGAGLDITRYLVGRPVKGLNEITVAEFDVLRKIADKPNAREALLAVRPLAIAWLKEQKDAAKAAKAETVLG